MHVRRSILRWLLAFVFAIAMSATACGGELPDSVHTEILRLSAEGDALAEEGDYAAAVASYTQAFKLLPEPRTDWEACTWLLTSIGDAHFNAKQYAQAKVALADAMHCPDAIGNPFSYDGWTK